MTWIAPMVTLFDGRQVASDSEEWRAECEARHLLAMPLGQRAETLAVIQEKRGAVATKALKMRCFELEPYYVLSLPNKDLRKRYVDAVGERFGPNAADALRGKARAIHEQRKVAADAPVTA